MSYRAGTRPNIIDPSTDDYPGEIQTSINGDADEVHVEMSFDGETSTRSLQQQGESVTFSVDPYLEDPPLGALFAFHLETNEARRGVVNETDL